MSLRVKADIPLDTNVFREQRRRGTEEGRNARPSRPSRWYNLYHTVKRYVLRAILVQAVLWTIGALLEPYMPEGDLGGEY